MAEHLKAAESVCLHLAAAFAKGCSKPAVEAVPEIFLAMSATRLASMFDKELLLGSKQHKLLAEQALLTF